MESIVSAYLPAQFFLYTNHRHTMAVTLSKLTKVYARTPSYSITIEQIHSTCNEHINRGEKVWISCCVTLTETRLSSSSLVISIIYVQTATTHTVQCRPMSFQCRSPVRRSRILWQIICVIRLFKSTVFGVSWSYSCLHTVRHNVSSALWQCDALYKFTVYLLTYLSSAMSSRIVVEDESIAIVQALFQNRLHCIRRT